MVTWLFITVSTSNFMILQKEVPTRNMNEYYLLQLVMLVEDAASVSIGCTYEVMYRSLGNMAFYWCDKLDLSTKDTNLLYNAFTQAVADAPESSLKQWIKECVLSGDFQRLKGQ